MTSITYQTNHTCQIFLNSSSANVYANGSMKSNCVFYFRNVLPPFKNSIKLRISIVKAQIPNSFYIINNTNNQIIVNGTTYTFPVGNYTITQFISQWATTVGSTWSLVFSSITNKLTFSNQGNTFTFTDNSQSIFQLLGFVKGTSYGSVGGYLTSTYSVDFSGIRNVIVFCNSVNVNNFYCSDQGCSNILGTIPNNYQPSSIIQYVNFTNFKNIFHASELSSLVIELLDDNLNPIDFNNVDWAITLQIDNICEVVKDFADLHDVYKKEVDNFNEDV
jgi:hypothetical protein